MSIMNLFNGGGSVRSEGRSRGSQGRPSLPTPTWDTEREYNKFQTRANEPAARLAEQWAFDMQRGRDQWPWTLDVTRRGQPRGQHKTEGQWNVRSSNFRPPTIWAENEGIGSTNEYQSAIDYSPNLQGRWLTESPTGNKFLSYLVNQFGTEGSSEYLEDALGKGGFPLWGGSLSPIIGDGRWGLNWSIGGG